MSAPSQPKKVFRKERHSGGPRGRRPRTFQAVQCTHYDRNCNLIAPCCGAIVCCHRGHDESLWRQPLHRRKVRRVLCCSGRTIQPVDRACQNCGRLFGAKSCIYCRMWYSGEGFHCNKCDRCIVGGRARHCDICGKCYPDEPGPFGHLCLSRTQDFPSISKGDKLTAHHSRQRKHKPNDGRCRGVFIGRHKTFLCLNCSLCCRGVRSCPVC